MGLLMLVEEDREEGGRRLAVVFEDFVFVAALPYDAALFAFDDLPGTEVDGALF